MGGDLLKKMRKKNNERRSLFVWTRAVRQSIRSVVECKFRGEK